MLLALIAPLSLALPTDPAPSTGLVQERERRGRPDRGERRERPRGDADWAFRAHRSGQMLSLSEIEARVIPTMRGMRYIGSTFDRDSATYTLKFMRDTSVVWVDVDGRTGRIVGR